MTLNYPPILMYHSISRSVDDPNLLCTSPERFNAQMGYLKRHRLRGVSTRELLHAMKAGRARGLVGLTFDDGYEDFLHTAVPIMESYGFSATVFAVGGMLGGRNSWKHAYEPRPDMRLLGATGLREVSQRGMEVASHSMSHPILTDLNTESLEKEIFESRRVLCETLGEEVEGFCYPYGRLDGAAIRTVRGAGYTYACAINTLIEGKCYDLPRVPIMGDRDTSLRFAVKFRFFSQARTAKRKLHRSVCGSLAGLVGLSRAEPTRQPTRPDEEMTH